MSLPRGILPVLAFDSPELACRTAEVLLSEGVTQLEIVFRTPEAAVALEAVVKAFSELLIGAGTLKSTRDLRRAQEAGAKFFATPCPLPDVEELALRKGWTLVPGAATPGEAYSAHIRGFSCVKFFPAEVLGGLAWLKAVSAPLPEIRWLPTGGIGLEKADSYLGLSSVLAVGVGEIARPSDLKEGRWDLIRTNARKAGGINARLPR